MGGQACVLYGAAEFSRDTDIVILADQANLKNLTDALNELKAQCIAVPELSLDKLHRGHAVHYRCYRDDVEAMRVDIMSKLRGVDDFEKLWERRTSVELEEGPSIEVISLPDLVKAKKTQRDKDWPMIRRLLEAHFVTNRKQPSLQQINFWFLEARTPEMLLEIANDFPDELKNLVGERDVLKEVSLGNEELIIRELELEEKKEREIDKEYWKPLKLELEKLRLDRIK